MKYYVLALVSCLALASCTRPPATTPPHSEPIGLDTAPPFDTTGYGPDREFVRVDVPDSVTVSRPPTFLDKVLHRTPKPWKVAPVVAHQPINIGKRSNVSVYYGTANVNNNTVGKKGTGAAGEGAVATVVEKPKAPTNTGAGGTVTDNAKQGQRGGAAASAPGATATATTEKAGFPYWVLAIPVVLYLSYRKFFTV
jgi:hypothetical protein